MAKLGYGKNENKERTSKRTSIIPPSLPRTHKLAINLRSPITANSPPNLSSHLQTAANNTKMSIEHSRSTSAAGSSGHTASSSAGPSSYAGSSTCAGPSANALPNHVHVPWQFIESLPVAITKEKTQMPLPGTMGPPGFGGADITKFSTAYNIL